MSTSHEEQPMPSIKKIAGEHIDIELLDPVHFKTFLEGHKGTKGLYYSREDELIAPLKEVDVNYSRDAYHDTIDMSANISFDAYSFKNNDAESWHSTLENFIRECLSHSERDTYDLTHDMNGFYVPLDSNYAAHVKFDSTTHQCSIRITLEHMHELDFALDVQNISLNFDSGEDTDIYNLFEQFSKILAVSIDSIVSNYGMNIVPTVENRPAITISAPNLLMKHTIDAESNMPESELNVSEIRTFNSVGGLTAAKRRLEEITTSLKHPEIARAYGATVSHFILYGPPGTGKTLLANVFASEIDAALIEIDSTDIVDKYIGDSAKNLDAIFNEAEDQSRDEPVVLFFDEINAIIGKHGGSREYLSVVELFKKRLLNIPEHHQLIVVGTTNVDIDMIDDAMIRAGRMEAIYAPLPNETERHDIWATVLWDSYRKFTNNNIQPDMTERVFVPYEEDIEVSELAKISEGMTGADFEEILKQIRMTHMLHAHRTGEYKKVSQSDIIRQIHDFNR